MNKSVGSYSEARDIALAKMRADSQPELDRLRSINAELVKALHDVCTQYQKVRDADAGYTGIPSRSIDAARAALERTKK